MASRKLKATRPKPPEGMSDDAYTEFHRVCDVLEAEGRLDDADPAQLCLYAQTWDIYQLAVAGVRKNGIVTAYSNGNDGPSAYFRAMKEMGRLLRGLLKDLDFAPGARGKGDLEVADLEF
jgi:P27 family predicted phage terminase small subunit